MAEVEELGRVKRKRVEAMMELLEQMSGRMKQVMEQTSKPEITRHPAQTASAGSRPFRVQEHTRSTQTLASRQRTVLFKRCAL